MSGNILIIITAVHTKLSIILETLGRLAPIQLQPNIPASKVSVRFIICINQGSTVNSPAHFLHINDETPGKGDPDYVAEIGRTPGIKLQ
jgi:hypothetical protein